MTNIDSWLYIISNFGKNTFSKVNRLFKKAFQGDIMMHTENAKNRRENTSYKKETKTETVGLSRTRIYKWGIQKPQQNSSKPKDYAFKKKAVSKKIEQMRRSKRELLQLSNGLGAPDRIGGILYCLSYLEWYMKKKAYQNEEYAEWCKKINKEG